MYTCTNSKLRPGGMSLFQLNVTTQQTRSLHVKQNNFEHVQNICSPSASISGSLTIYVHHRNLGAWDHQESLRERSGNHQAMCHFRGALWRFKVKGHSIA